MPQVTVTSEIEANAKLMLRNGGILIYKDQVFYIASSTNGNGKYCSIIKLSTGNRVCTEPVSRDTNKVRVANHLRTYKVYDPKILLYMGPSDYSLAIKLNSEGTEYKDDTEVDE